MRKVEHIVQGEDLTSLMAALEEECWTEAKLWSRDIDLGEGYVAEVKIVGGGKDGQPWVDVTLFERVGGILSEVRPLDKRDSPFGEMAFDDIGVVLNVVEGPAPTPAP